MLYVRNELLRRSIAYIAESAPRAPVSGLENWSAIGVAVPLALFGRGSAQVFSHQPRRAANAATQQVSHV